MSVEIFKVNFFEMRDFGGSITSGSTIAIPKKITSLW